MIFWLIRVKVWSDVWANNLLKFLLKVTRIESFLKLSDKDLRYPSIDFALLVSENYLVLSQAYEFSLSECALVMYVPRNKRKRWSGATRDLGRQMS